jgi:hypothetical protein
MSLNKQQKRKGQPAIPASALSSLHWRTVGYVIFTHGNSKNNIFVIHMQCKQVYKKSTIVIIASNLTAENQQFSSNETFAGSLQV